MDIEQGIREHLGLAHYYAGREYNGHSSYDEIYADALVGLWKAVRDFDEGVGVRFTTYAHHRIVGNIRDGVRERDVLSRSQRQAGDIENPISLESRVIVSDRTGALRLEDIVADPSNEIEQIIEDEDAAATWTLIKRCFRDLPDDDCYVLTRYHVDGITLAEIGTEMNITESRVCQIHGRALHRLGCLVSELGIAS